MNERTWQSFPTVCALLGVLVVPAPTPAADDSVNGTATVKPDTLERKRERVVVTASRREQILDEAPASVSVLENQQITQTPVDDYGDLLRQVPGVNVAQTSALDLSIAPRSSTGVLPQGVLALVDHRFVYQDYNNFVLWIGVPLELEEIDRIEVVRGPGSAMWGANAADGVVHIITKRPRDSVGTVVKLGGGELGSGFGSVVHNGVEGNLAYRISGGWATQDPYELRTGTIPGTVGPTNPEGTPYPAFDNLGSDVLRGNVRLDYDVSPNTRWSFSSGYSEFKGTFLTPGGTYGYDDGAFNSFAKVDFEHDSFRATLFTNIERSAGEFLTNPLIPNQFDYETINLDLTDSRAVGEHHLLTYGASARYSWYEIGLAPGGKERDQYGAFLEDDIYLNEQFRLVVGVRLDHVDVMGQAISPRASLLVTPIDNHQFRVSYNRAFLAPSILENHADVPLPPIVITIPGPGGDMDLVFPQGSKGSLDLEEEKLDAIEVAWTGQVTDRTRVSVAAYRNQFTDAIQQITEFYSSANPPPGWPLPPEALDTPPPGGFAGIPSQFVYANVGQVTYKGVEVSAEVRATREMSLFANYSWQDVPDIEDFSPAPLPNGSARPAINVPPRTRVNAGVLWDDDRFFANGSLSFQEEAFWTDISDPRNWGPTDRFTMVNAGLGVRLDGGRIVWSVAAQNLFDTDAQQHVWGDVIGRKVTSQVVFRF